MPQKSTFRHSRKALPIPEERRLGILEAISERPLVRADEIAAGFAVSAETVRRDFLALEQEGLLRRVYGGAVRPTRRAIEVPYAERRGRFSERKRAMAALAASLVMPGDTLILDVGTSVAEVARVLSQSYRGRVLTNSLLAAVELANHEGVDVLTAGGQVRPGDLACSGPHAEAFFASYYADKAFLGSGGVHPQAGLTDYHPSEIPCRLAMLSHSAQRFVLADSSKLGEIAVARVCDLDNITAVITDSEADGSILATLREVGLDVMVATGTN
jgi:DeoR/GlpR family transcriptional regulator of sugar metabolism